MAGRRRIGFVGPGPAAIVRLNSWMALVRLTMSGSVGWYKAWALGEWSSPDPVPLFELFSLNGTPLGEAGRAKGPFRWINALAHRLRDNAPAKAKANIAAHYDLGNDFYAAWLDPTMTYSSARFASQDEPLEAAQLRKITLLLDRLELEPGQRLLEIGCGWGSLAIEAARRGVQVVGLTLSDEQKAWAEAKAAEAGLGRSDRDPLAGLSRDRRAVRRDCLGRDGRSGRHALVGRLSRFHRAQPEARRPSGAAVHQHRSSPVRPATPRSADFIQAYIFPGGMLLDEPRFAELAKQRGLSWEDRDDFALDYAATLKAWRKRYDDAVARGMLEGFGEQFHELWRYYLMYCEGGFRGRRDRRRAGDDGEALGFDPHPLAGWRFGLEPLDDRRGYHFQAA